MRLLHVIDSLGRGGAERVVATLAVTQRRMNDVAVLSLFSPNHLADELRARGVLVVTPGAMNHRRLLRNAGLVYRTAREFKADAVHAHLTFATIATAMAPLGSARRIATFHNLGVASGLAGGLATKSLRAALRVASTRFHQLTAVSPASSEAYRRELSLAEAPLVVSNPVDAEALSATVPLDRLAARERLAIDARSAVVVCVAKFTWEKGHEVLMEALAKLSASLPDLRLVLVGDGPLRAALQERALALGVSARVKWAGELAHEQALLWMKAASVVVLPSRAEGQPVTLLEAMSIGVPVVATRVGGVPLMLEEDRGVLVDAGDPAALAAAIASAVGAGELSDRRVERARRWIAASFSPAAIAAQWQQIYSE